MELVQYLLSFSFILLLGLLPALTAKNKGRNFWLWWFYGTLVFIVAAIHAALLIPEPRYKNKSKMWNMACIFGHKYSCCVCLRCGKTDHETDGCICKKCGKYIHEFEIGNSYRCKKFNYIAPHLCVPGSKFDWERPPGDRFYKICECMYCDKEVHDIKECRCSICNNEFHNITKCVCNVCGRTIHEWDARGCCTKCKEINKIEYNLPIICYNCSEIMPYLIITNRVSHVGYNEKSSVAICPLCGAERYYSDCGDYKDDGHRVLYVDSYKEGDTTLICLFCGGQMVSNSLGDLEVYTLERKCPRKISNLNARRG